MAALKCTNALHAERNPRNAGFEHLAGLWSDRVLLQVSGNARTQAVNCPGCGRQDRIDAAMRVVPEDEKPIDEQLAKIRDRLDALEVNPAALRGRQP